MGWENPLYVFKFFFARWICGWLLSDFAFAAGFSIKLISPSRRACLKAFGVAEVLSVLACRFSICFKMIFAFAASAYACRRRVFLLLRPRCGIFIELISPSRRAGLPAGGVLFARWFVFVFKLFSP